jgi:acyl transferase domain-containing protein
MSSNIYNDALNDMESPVGGLAPLAIVGFSLKFPQDANTPQGFWKVMEERRSVMTDWPTDRINLDAFYHRDIGRENQV